MADIIDIPVYDLDLLRKKAIIALEGRGVSPSAEALYLEVMTQRSQQLTEWRTARVAAMEAEVDEEAKARG